MRGPWLLGLCLMWGCATTGSQRELVEAMEQQGSNGPHYEYRVIDFGSSDPRTIEEFLNRAGRLGWRVAVQSGSVVTFERRVE